MFSQREFDSQGEGTAYKMLGEQGFEVTQWESETHTCMPLEEAACIRAEYDAVITMGIRLDEEFMQRMSPRLKLVIRYGSGFDEIDTKAAKKYGIAVATTKVPELSNGVAELAQALMLSLLYRIPQNYEEYVGRGIWNQQIRSVQAAGKTIGFFGFGSIAQCFAEKLAGSGMKMLAHDPYPVWERAEKLGVEMVSFDELLSKSDIISVHVPGTKENEKLFNQDTFSKMKDGGYFINAARGILVDEEALYRALVSGKLKGAACDTLWPEPPSRENPLFELENFIATPHIGGHTIEGRRKMTVLAAQEIIDFFSGKTICNRVN